MNHLVFRKTSRVGIRPTKWPPFIQCTLCLYFLMFWWFTFISRIPELVIDYSWTKLKIVNEIKKNALKYKVNGTGLCFLHVCFRWTKEQDSIFMSFPSNSKGLFGENIVALWSKLKLVVKVTMVLVRPSLRMQVGLPGSAPGPWTLAGWQRQHVNMLWALKLHVTTQTWH